MHNTRSAGFEPVHAVATLLYGLTVPWWITGGWAIDLAVGHVTRDHTDVNVMMLERDEHALRGLTGIDIQLIADGQPPGPWPVGSRLTAGPAPGLRRPFTGPDRLILRGEDLPLPAEVIIASAVGAFWVYKHGAHILTRPLAEITRYQNGIPYLAPEVVLAIKARPETDNAQRDFEAALPVLTAEQRSWLKDAIERQSWLKDAIEREPQFKDATEPQPRRKEAKESQPRPPRKHRWAAELADEW
jgi:Aminoglycoside-2''-adenylyltransferase